MIFPMMVGVDFASIKDIGRKPKGLVITLVINWLVKPFTMAALAVLFFDYLYADLLPRADAQEYIAGLILLGAAPCTAMVFVWSQMTRGDPAYTLVQVSVNDLVMIVAFAPLVALLRANADAFINGNAAGVAFGQPPYSNIAGDTAGQQNPWLIEWFYRYQVSDNISITPTLFYGSSIANNSASTSNNYAYTGLGGVIQTTFKF